MVPLLLPDEVHRLDEACKRELDLDPLALMEQAATAATAVVRSFIKESTKARCSIAFACGSGNNGGDGFCIARMLSADYDVVVICDDPAAGMSLAAKTNYARLPSNVCVIGWGLPLPIQFDFIVDAIIGVGGSAQLRDPIPDRLRKLQMIGGIRIAIDVPTGLDAQTGMAHDDTFEADATVTIETEKPGFYRNRGREVVGKVVVAKIGIPNDLAMRFATTFRLELDDIRRLLPARDASTSKFTYGHVVVIGGTTGMRGAPSLTAHSAIASGAGLVVLAAPSIHPLTPREIMTAELPAHDDGTIHTSAREQLCVLIKRATVIAIGPGLGTNEATISMLASVLDEFSHVPCVIDADGLRMVPLLKRPLTNVVLTPHLGEFARLIGKERASIVDPVVAAQDLAKEQGVIVHLKGTPSVSTNGMLTYLTTAGNPGMATAGSGDVLTGVIAGLAAQNVSMMNSAALGSFLHATAGDNAAHERSQEGMMAGDIITALQKLFS